MPDRTTINRRKYVWGPAGPAYIVDATSNVSVYHTDGLGSVRAITDGSGAVTQTERTDAFGQMTSAQGGSRSRLTTEHGD